MTPESQQRQPLSAREAARSVAARLKSSGHLAYFAGGCVRDHLCGIEPTDYDIATDANPTQIAALFKGARGVGEAFGVMLVRAGGRTIEVATFRSEGEYSDGRRPSEVRFSTAREDALRRDFTINGLFEDPATGQVIDFVDGQADIRAKVLRAIGDPSHRFREDRLRTLRAVRFLARFGLSIDPQTEAAVRAFSHDLKGVSPERVGAEVRRMLAHPSRVVAITKLEEWGLDCTCLGEANSTGSLERVVALPGDAPVPSALAAWKLDRAGRTAAPTSGNWTATLVLSNREVAQIDSTLEMVESLRDSWNSLATSKRKRLAAGSSFASALLVLAGTHPELVHRVREDVLELSSQEGGLAPRPFISGHDLVAAGLVPGPRFKSVLDELYDRQLEGEFCSADAARKALSLLVGGT